MNNPYKYYDPDGQVVQVIAAEKAIELLGWALGAIIVGKAGEEAYKNSKDGMYNESTNENSDSSNEKGKNTGKLEPVPDAEGPHSVAKRDPKTGKVEKYETYKPQSNPRNPNPWESEKRYDSKGDPHYNKKTGRKVPTPHVHDPKTPGGVRGPKPDEIP